MLGGSSPCPAAQTISMANIAAKRSVCPLPAMSNIGRFALSSTG